MDNLYRVKDGRFHDFFDLEDIDNADHVEDIDDIDDEECEMSGYMLTMWKKEDFGGEQCGLCCAY